MFLARSGQWKPRQLLVASENATDLAPDFEMDPEFRLKAMEYAPQDWFDAFPKSEDSVEASHSDLIPYRRWVSPAFDGICRELVGSTPQTLPIISGYEIAMPPAWRLLPHVTPRVAAELTKLIVKILNESAEKWAPVTLTHATRANAYPRVTAAHPIFHWLTEHGRVRIGKFLFPLKGLVPEHLELLSAAGLDLFHDISAFFNARATEIQISPKLAWTKTALNQRSKQTFWAQIFSIVETRREGLSDLSQVWESAQLDQAVPSSVPTAQGPIAISEIFVSSDERLRGDGENGRLVILNDATAAVWIAAGAQALGQGPQYAFDQTADEPARLLDMFPELTAVRDRIVAPDETFAISVVGLHEQVGPHARKVAAAIDADGNLLVDKAGSDRANLVQSVLRCLSHHDKIALTEDLNDLIRQVFDRRTEEARQSVREAATLEQRLLKSVGDEREVLLQSMTDATRLAVEASLSQEDVARLALAVHGPAILSRLRDAMERQGLDPPRRWGGESARAFVTDLGFPLEFASSAGGRREAELTVSGPIKLPPLHDYQNAILDDVTGLLVSGQGRRRAVISLPTGGGKTRVAAETVVRLVLRGDGRRAVLWIAQTDELCEQAVQCFRQLWVNVGEPGEDLRIVRFWGGQRTPTPSDDEVATVVVASIQTLNSRSSRDEAAWIARSGIVVIDECHHAITTSYTQLMRWLDLQVGSEKSRDRETPVIGLSATPWRGYNEEESERLAARFDRRWFPSDQAALHDKLSRLGVLAARSYVPLHHRRQVQLTAKEIQHVEIFGELPDSVVDRIAEDDDRNKLIIDAVLNSDAQSILLFANSVAHAQYLAARLHLASCPSAAVSGETDRLTRQHFTRRFRTGDLRIICNHSVLTTGFDAPKADMIVISRPVFSPVLYMQMVGRGLRGPANGGTEHCDIVTVEDNIQSFSDRLAYHFCRRFFDA